MTRQKMHAEDKTPARVVAIPLSAISEVFNESECSRSDLLGAARQVEATLLKEGNHSVALTSLRRMIRCVQRTLGTVRWEDARKLWDDDVMVSLQAVLDGSDGAAPPGTPIKAERQRYLSLWRSKELGAPPLDVGEPLADDPLTKSLDLFLPAGLRFFDARRRLAEIEGKARDGSSKRGTASPGGVGKKHKRQSFQQKPLTGKQIEAVHIVAECKGDIAEAARHLGVDRATVKQHYDAAMHKMGKTAVKRATRPLPEDRRGQVAVSEDRRRS